MTDQAPEKPKSFLYIEFADIGSVMFRMNTEGITPLQLLAIASYLEVRGKNELIKQENEKIAREAEMKLLVPDKHVQVANGRVG